MQLVVVWPFRQPAPPGGVLLVYFTGQGALDQTIDNGAAAPFEPLIDVSGATTAAIGGQHAQVIFCGMAPGMVGLAQANLVVPALPSGDYPLVLTIGGVSTNPAWVSVGAP